jgi:hypothetical protein
VWASASGPWMIGHGVSGPVTAAGRREVAVFEAVAVALEGEDLGVADEAVDHRGGDDVVSEDLALG